MPDENPDSRDEQTDPFAGFDDAETDGTDGHDDAEAEQADPDSDPEAGLPDTTDDRMLTREGVAGDALVDQLREYAERAYAATRAFSATALEYTREYGGHASATARAYTAAAAEWTRETGLPWCRHQLRNVRTLPGRAKERAILTILGPSDTIGTRIGSLLMFVALAVLAAAGLFALDAGLDTTADSSWFMAQVIGTATSVWTYAALLLLLFVVVRSTEKKRKARRAASKTGFTVTTVSRLAAEASTADGTSTVVVSPADTVGDAADRIVSAFETPYSGLGIDWSDHHTLDENIVDAASTSADATEEDALVLHERANADPEEHARLTRLEIASTLNFTDVLWSFAVPAIATAIAALVLVQFWAPLWMYALIGAGSVVVGAGWYVGSHSLRRRRVRSVRQPDHAASYSDIGVLVKKVETEDVTAYYGWVDGQVYADYNELRLAWTLAEVAHACIEGEPKPPTIQQKFARNLRQYLPNLEGYEEAIERPEVTDRIIQTVAETESGRMPKNRLADRVIRTDQQRIGGIGYDPRIVADAYDAITPYALVETVAEVDTPTEGTKEMTVVRLRNDTTNREAIETDAQFSAVYQPDYEPDFDLPDVSMRADV